MPKKHSELLKMSSVCLKFVSLYTKIILFFYLMIQIISGMLKNFRIAMLPCYLGFSLSAWLTHLLLESSSWPFSQFSFLLSWGGRGRQGAGEGQERGNNANGTSRSNYFRTYVSQYITMRSFCFKKNFKRFIENLRGGSF